MGEFARIHQTDLTDRQLMDFWDMAIRSGRDRQFFFDIGPVSPGEFCGMVRTNGGHLWLVTFRGVTCGMFLLRDVKGKSAKAHFLTLPCGTCRTGTKGVSVIRGMGLYAIGQALWERTETGRFRLDRLIGITPTYNEKAVKYVRSLGAEFLSVIPDWFYHHDEGVNVDGLVSSFTRKDVPAWYADL